MFEHIMLDLETLDSTPTAAILSIGAVRFDLQHFSCDSTKFYTRIDLCDEHIGKELTVSGHTIRWWMGQSDFARSSLIGPNVSLGDALVAFSRYVESVPGSHVWGNGSMFDNLIITHAYKVYGLPRPWSFNQDMDYRTIKKVLGHLAPDPPQPPEHNALIDAKFQATHLISIFQAIKEKVGNK